MYMIYVKKVIQLISKLQLSSIHININQKRCAFFDFETLGVLSSAAEGDFRISSLRSGNAPERGMRMDIDPNTYKVGPYQL